MSALSLNEEQTKLLRICIKHAEPLKVWYTLEGCEATLRVIFGVEQQKLTKKQPNWEKVKEEAELVSTSAA